MEVGGHQNDPRALPLGKNPGTFWIEGWVCLERRNLSYWYSNQKRSVLSESLYRLHSPHRWELIIIITTNIIVIIIVVIFGH